MKKKIKIAMLIDGWTPIFWWWQIHVNELCKWLINNYYCNIDLYVRKLKNDKWLKFDKDEILLNWKLKIFKIWPITKFFNIFWRILSLINTIIYLLIKTKKEKYNIIHAYSYVSWLPAIIVWKICNIPVVYTVLWANNIDLKKKWFLVKIEKWLLTWIKYDLEISVFKSFFKHRNINKNIVVIHNGVDILKFNKAKVLHKYEWFNLLRVWRFNREKGVKYLIKWVALINKDLLKKNKFKLNLVWDWILFEEMRKLSLLLWINEFINFKWKLYWESLIKEYIKNHVFILPSLAEWQPLTILEAFASKIPVIATNVWDNKYFIKDNNWFLIKPEDKYEIKNVIEKVLKKDSIELLELWKNWYDFIKNSCTWDIMVDKVFSEYVKLINL